MGVGYCLCSNSHSYAPSRTRPVKYASTRCLKHPMRIGSSEAIVEITSVNRRNRARSFMIRT